MQGPSKSANQYLLSAKTFTFLIPYVIDKLAQAL